MDDFHRNIDQLNINRDLKRRKFAESETLAGQDASRRLAIPNRCNTTRSQIGKPIKAIQIYLRSTFAGVAVTQEFHLCVTHIEQDVYQLWTECVPQEVPFAKELVNWHVSDWLVEVEHLKPVTQDVQNFGQKLYDALFVGSIGNSWNVAQSIAQENQQLLRLHLKCDRNVAQLPWELLNTVSTINLHIELIDLDQDDTVNLGDWNDATTTDNDRDATYAEDIVIVSEIFEQLAHPATEENADVSAINNTNTVSLARIASAPPKTADEKRVLVAFVLGTLIMLVVGLGSLVKENQLLQQINLTRQNTHPNLQTASTAQITATAIAQLQQQDAIAAQHSIAELLNRKALQNANIALSAAPQNLANSDTILFLRGRVAWQSLHVEQAQHYWQAAVKQKPDSAKYYNALGFAYYAQGNLNQANEAWFQALYSVNQAPATTEQADREMLTAYAGLALVLHQSAQNPAAAEPAKLTNEAMKLCQKVLAEAPVEFQPQHLHNNWLWHPKAVKDWRSLLSRTHRTF